MEYLAKCGYDPSWLEGAPALADWMEDTLTDKRKDPLPLDPNGKAASALIGALSLCGPASHNAMSDQAQVLKALRSAR